MKTILTLTILLISICVNAQSGNITVGIPGVKQAKGAVLICLYNSSETFLDSDKMYKKAVIKATVTKSSYTFKAVPEGEYAIHVFWDENDNGEMDANFIGMPKEEVGFSQNVLGTFGPPSFDDASFMVIPGETAELVIMIKKPSHF